MARARPSSSLTVALLNRSVVSAGCVPVHELSEPRRLIVHDPVLLPRLRTGSVSERLMQRETSLVSGQP